MKATAGLLSGKKKFVIISMFPTAKAPITGKIKLDFINKIVFGISFNLKKRVSNKVNDLPER
jgi:hypothetical protein